MRCGGIWDLPQVYFVAETEDILLLKRCQNINRYCGTKIMLFRTMQCVQTRSQMHGLLYTMLFCE